MKLLFLNTAKVDYKQDILFAGLRKRKDIDLYEYPFNKYYHLPLKKYPKNLGYKSEGLVRALFRPIPWKQLDAVIVGGCSPTIAADCLKILTRITPSAKLILVDGGDYPEIGGDFYRLGGGESYERLIAKRPFDLIFKREMIIGQHYPSSVIPFPFGFNLERLPANIKKSKKYDVTFWAVESDSVRTKALQLLSGKFDCDANGTSVNQEFSKYKRKGDFYLEEISRCKIVLNLRGAGWDTLRYWETPALGTFMISQKPGIVIPNNFRDGQEIVFCKDDLSDLVDLCQYYLDHEHEREQIATNSEAWLRKYHNEDVGAAFFLDHLRGH